MNPIENKIIGVIGYGKFGRVVCEYIFPKNTIIVYSNNLSGVTLAENCSEAKSIEDLVNQSDIIIPAVPIRKFEEVIMNISKNTTLEKIILDVCSVMEYPVNIMTKYLPKNSGILATHPMFGPNSIQKNNNKINGLKIVLSNVSLKESLYNDFKNYFSQLGLQIVSLTPGEHDEYSAKSQFFALLVGELAQNLKLNRTPIDTPGANAIFDSLIFMGMDRKIIEDMIEYNTFCNKIYMEIIKILDGLKKHE